MRNSVYVSSTYDSNYESNRVESSLVFEICNSGDFKVVTQASLYTLFHVIVVSMPWHVSL